jgi:hypothetical protein
MTGAAALALASGAVGRRRKGKTIGGGSLGVSGAGQAARRLREPF